MYDGMGTGVCCSELDLKQPFKLSDYCSIFQAKIFAVKKQLRQLTKQENTLKIYQYIPRRSSGNQCNNRKSYQVRKCTQKQADDRCSACRKAVSYILGSRLKGIPENETVNTIRKSAIRLCAEPVRGIFLNDFQERKDHMKNTLRKPIDFLLSWTRKDWPSDILQPTGVTREPNGHQ